MVAQMALRRDPRSISASVKVRFTPRGKSITHINCYTDPSRSWGIVPNQIQKQLVLELSAAGVLLIDCTTEGVQQGFQRAVSTNLMQASCVSWNIRSRAMFLAVSTQRPGILVHMLDQIPP